MCKVCTKCNIEKESNNFPKRGSSKDGLSSWCKLCKSEYNKEDNWGEWHIDHKYPLSKFDKNTPVHIANSLDNLQPLWAFDNISKGNKIIKE